MGVNQDAIAVDIRAVDIRAVDIRAAKSPRKASRWFRGWRTNIIAGVFAVAIVLIANVGVLAWAGHTYGFINGNATIYSGSFDEMKRISTYAHLLINILSTLLLAASNSAMQCLSAPTRAEVDKAHQKGVYLDIGVPSVRNLRSISAGRVVLWAILGLSSLPLHLIYNAVIFETQSANDYLAVLVGNNFFDAAPWNQTVWGQWLDTWTVDRVNANLTGLQTLQNNPSGLIRMDPAECIQTYGTTVVSAYSNVFAVSNTSNTFDCIYNIIYVSTLSSDASGDFDWVCPPDQNGVDGSDTGSSHYCGLQVALASASNWELQALMYGPNGTSLLEFVTVDYCMAQPATGTNAVGLNMGLMILVIICNAIKFVCLFMTLRSIKHDPLITLGDAINSFLDTPDPATVGFSTLSFHDVRAGRWKPVNGYQPVDTHVGQPWEGKKHFWFYAASRRRWLVYSFFVSILWIIGFALLMFGLFHLTVGRAATPPTTTNLSNLGFGVPGRSNLLQNFGASYNMTLAAAAILANLPQLALSLVYFMYNGLLTAMLTMAEWLSFARKRQALRVSRPRGSQRSTLYLQLPFHYAIPLLLTSGILHWLLSQSLFLVRIQIAGLSEYHLPDNNRLVSAVAWSPLALIPAVALFFVMMLALWLLGLRRFNGDMPLAPSCSVAIAAASRTRRGVRVAVAPGEEQEEYEGEEDVAAGKIMWGAIAVLYNNVHLAGFSTGQVSHLVNGQIYR